MVALAQLNGIKERIASLRLPALGSTQTRTAFMRGAIAVLALYSLFFALVFIRSGATLEAAQNNLPSKTVIIESSAPIKIAHGDSHAVKGATNHGEATNAIADATSPFTHYKKTVALPAGKKYISVLVTDIHTLNDATKRSISALPDNVSYVVSPYSQSIEAIEDYLYGAKREIWLSLPMERVTKSNQLVDPGPKAILSRLSFGKNQDNLNWALERAHYYAGLAGFSSATFIKNQPVMRLLLKDIFSHGLGLLDLNPEGLGYFEQNAAYHNAPYMRGAVNLSLEQWQGRSKAAFNAVQEQARDYGSALVVVPHYPKLMSDLELWLKTLDREFAIVPPSSVAGMGIADDLLFSSPK